MCLQYKLFVFMKLGVDKVATYGHISIRYVTKATTTHLQHTCRNCCYLSRGEVGRNSLTYPEALVAFKENKGEVDKF